MTFKKAGSALVVGGMPRLNLLPPQELEKRARAAMRGRWLKIFVVALVAVALAWVIGLRWNMLAHDDLGASVQDSEQVQSDLAAYSEVIEVQSAVRNLGVLRERAGSNDQNWGMLVTEIKSVLPPGVGLIGFKLVPGAAPLPATDLSAQVGLQGTLTFSAKATSAQAGTITALRKVKGFNDVDAGALSSDGPAGGFTFVVTFRADQTRYTGRYIPIGSK